MLGHAEWRTLGGALRRLGHGGRYAEIAGIEGQGATAHREGQNRQAHARNRTDHESPGKQRGAPHGTARPKATASYIPMGALSATWTPMPRTPAVVPLSNFSVSYATCRPSIPSPTFAPNTTPMF